MRKLVALLFALLAFVNAGMAQEVSFIYLNGSGTNDPKTVNWFYDGIKKFHSNLKPTFENDPFVYKNMLKDGQYTIKNEPVVFFWGDETKAEIEFLKGELNLLDVTSPRMAQFVRSYVADCLHDAVWVSRMSNMHPILEKLHADVMKEYQKGNKVVLLGYSAGTFITYQYFLTRLPSIDFKEILKHTPDARRQLEIAASVPTKPTCVEALLMSKLLTYDIKGKFVANSNEAEFKNILSKLDSITAQSCAPQDAMMGIMNYASPVVLFYSEFNDPKFELSAAKALAYKYVIENDLFWLTVNYSDDPFGYPTTSNPTLAQVEKKVGFDVNDQGGFFYDRSRPSSHRTFLGAHTSYWATSKRYSKIVRDAYKEGYEHFYGIKENEN